MLYLNGQKMFLSGGGGHSIKNDSGTALAQKNNLKFAGVYSHNTTDDSVVDIVREFNDIDDIETLTGEAAKGFQHIDDDVYDKFTAGDIGFDNSDTSFTGTDVQEVLEEVDDRLTPLEKNVSNRTNFGFPKYQSEVSGDNYKWTAPANGIAFIQIVFDSNNYSQIQVGLNSKAVTNGMLSSNGKNLEDVSVMLTVPLQKNDILSVGFYQNYGVKKCDVIFLS